MKKFYILFFLMISIFLYSESKWSYYSHSQIIEIGDSFREGKNIYQEHNAKSTLLFKIFPGNRIKIIEVAQYDFENINKLWIKIQLNNNVGWFNLQDIDLNNKVLKFPYGNDNWKFEERIKFVLASWNIRRVRNQKVKIKIDTEFYEKPNFKKITKLISTKNKNNYKTSSLLFVTEEFEFLNGSNNRWYCVDCGDNHFWWIHGSNIIEESDFTFLFSPNEIIEYYFM